MANTEGIPDEKLASLLSFQDAIPSPSSKSPSSSSSSSSSQRTAMIPRGYLERQRMMDAYNPADTVEDPTTTTTTTTAAATVIRASNKHKPPIVKSTTSSKSRNTSAVISAGSSLKSNVPRKIVRFQEEEEEEEDKTSYHSRSKNSNNSNNNTKEHHKNHDTTLPPAIVSNSIRERPVLHSSKLISARSGVTNEDENQDGNKKVSKFKLRQQKKNEDANHNDDNKKIHIHASHASMMNTITTSTTFQKINQQQPIRKTFIPVHENGFPSFDNIPIGSLTKKGKLQTTKKQSKLQSTTTPATPVTPPTISDADKMIANMTQREIQENVQELQSILSMETIQFLRNRTKNKNQMSSLSSPKVNTAGICNHDDIASNHCIKNEEKGKLSSSTIQSKEEMGKMLANIKTEDELDEIYAKTILGIEFNNNYNNNNINNNNIESQQENPQQEYYNNEESELETATKLLRSTVLRQRLLGAKSICAILHQKLNDHLETLYFKRQQHHPTSSTSIEALSKEEENDESYPKILPVALRCLLDLPSPTKHSILFSYVLQSIHCLILLFAHVENHLYFACDSNKLTTILSSNSSSSSFEDPKSIYQLCFMDDYIPTPSSRNLYLSSTSLLNQQQQGTNNNKDEKNNPVAAGCYATDSSAESAGKDSDAFYNDPLWTLLSRMKILPCIAHILSPYSNKKKNDHGGSSSSSLFWKKNKEMVSLQSVESISSICGILAMLSVRSPGAACAIAQHKSIIPILISISLQPKSSDDTVDSADDDDGNTFVVHTKLALPTIRLICNLCRQSRSVAMSEWMISVMDSITMVLATKAEKEDEWDLQQWCIILWRTLLRYGLAISYTSTILPMSIADLTVKKEEGYCLSSVYLSTYATLCDCVKASRNDEKLIQSLNGVDLDVLDGSSSWLASHVKSCAEYLSNLLHLSSNEDDEALIMRLASARISLLHSYKSACDNKTTERSGTLIPIISRETYVMALKAVVQAKVLHKAVLETMKSLTLEDEKTTRYKKQASSCSLVYSFFTALSNLLNDCITGEDADTIGDSDNELLRLVSDVIEYVLSVVDTHGLALEQTAHLSSCERGWKNKAHFAIAKLMTRALSSEILHLPDSALPMTQSFCFTLIGKFGRGDEVMAAILLSQGILFDIRVGHGDTRIVSMNLIQEVMLREIMDTSNQSQTQLNHSAKLLGGAVETYQVGGGPFLLESLRCEADRSNDPATSTANNDDKFEVLSLPLGHDWLYQLLCGKIELGDDPQQKAMRLHSTSNIVISALKLILYMEDEGSFYTKQISSGTKLYFMLNACLFPEEIVRHDLFTPLFYNLFQRYSQSDDQSNVEKARSFIVTCFRHSSNQQVNSNNNNNISKHQQSKSGSNTFSEDQILSLFFDTRSGEEKKMKLSPKDLKAVDDFISDICKAFTDYGAQYDFFCTSMRFLLMSGFPSRNRIIILQQLKDLLHLLTTETESDDLTCISIQQSLSKSFSGGLPLRDGSRRDPAELLDVIASYVQRPKYNSVKQGGGFFYLYCIGSLARNLSSSSIRCECGLNAMKRRLRGMNQELLEDIFTVSFAVVKDVTGGKVDDLVNAVLQSCIRMEQKSKSSWAAAWYESNYDDEVWDGMIKQLQRVYSKNSTEED